MNSIEVIVDSTSSKLPQSPEAKQQGIRVVPIHVIWDIRGKPPISLPEDQITETIYMENSCHASPQTAGIVDAFSTHYEEVFQKGNSALVFTISANASGIHNAARTAGNNAAEKLGTGSFHVVDSETTSAALWYMALRAKEIIQPESRLAEIAAQIEAERHKFGILVTLTTEGLEKLRRGGRGMQVIKAMAAQKLGIIPIIGFKDGVLDVIDTKARTQSKAVERMMDRVADLPDLRRVGVLHTGDTGLSQKVIIQMRQLIKCPVIDEGFAGYVLRSHAGRGAVAIAWEQK